jgi:site-specific DNA-adenine methylase
MRWIFPYEGGKSREVEVLGALKPENYDIVLEPFAGSHVWSRWLYINYPDLQFKISDSNDNLIRFLKWIRKTNKPLDKLKSYTKKNLNRTHRNSLFDKLNSGKPLTPKEYYFINRVQRFRPKKSNDPFVSETELNDGKRSIKQTIINALNSDHSDELFAVEFLKSHRVTISKLNWDTATKRLLKNPKALILMDPPYDGTKSIAYDSKFNFDDIVSLVKNSKATVLVSWGRKEPGLKPFYEAKRGTKGLKPEDHTSKLISVGYVF